MALLEKSNYDNEIVLVKSIRQQICKKLGIAEITFRKAVKEFEDKGILTCTAKGVYVANAFLFGRGSWNDIKNIRLLIQYNADGRFILKQSGEEQQQEIDFPNQKRLPKSGVRFDDKIGSEGTEII
jgi:hypothetical protein